MWWPCPPRDTSRPVAPPPAARQCGSGGGRTGSASQQVQNAATPRAAAKPAEPAAPAKGPILLGDEWSDLIATLTLDPPVRNFARNAALEQQSGEQWQLAISPRFEALYKDENLGALQDAIRTQTGKPVTLKVAIQEPAKPTPDQLLAKHKQARQQQAIELLQQDDFVQMLQQHFGATLDLGSVTPLDD
ncbi:MAG: DNA polymerase III subunit gamma/tau C-terminal domain-containing protein [Gammaproteobacteria bacterium]